jgi:hypothetical protein
MASMNYLHLAKQVLAESLKRGDTSPGLDGEQAGRLESYKEWLETYVMALVFEEVLRLGRLREFTSLPEGDDSIRDDFLERTMPNYEEFLKRAANEAGYALLGSSTPQSVRQQPSATASRMSR